MSGYNIKQAPRFEDLNLGDITFSDTFLDHEPFKALNKVQIQNIMTLRAINTQMDLAERKRTALQTEYKKKFRQAVMSSSAKTDSQKKMLAEIMLEDTEADIMYLDQLIEEYKRRSNSLRLEMDTMKTIGFNLGKEMTV